MDTFDEFSDFHAKNPQIYAAFCKISRREIARLERQHSGAILLKKLKGYLSASSVCDEIRNDRSIKTTTLRDTGLKINRNHHAYYARLFMEDHPQYTGVYEVRSIKTSEKAIDLFGEKATSRYTSKRSDHY